ncbi:MerR family transcriptional regulator [Janibacter sp. GXQ6167]|uniref:transcriptional regulator FtsR n=1 Tax=Janibacter sp. GXQ6167 TaxID=3240791 RepID=UPI00352617A9
MPSTPRGLIGIGAVLDALKGDFPDISISKIRYLETEGLINPHRTASGYRKYARSDLDRLRLILTWQRDRFWPLKVIGERLDALDRGLEVSEGGATAPAVTAGEAAALPDADALRQVRPLRLRSAELQEQAGIDRGTLRELVSYGLISAEDGWFGADDLDAARAAGALVAAGIDVRHLRPFRTAADREVDLVEHVLGRRGLHGGVAGTEGLDDETVAAQVAADCLALHVAMVKRALRHR